MRLDHEDAAAAVIRRGNVDWVSQASGHLYQVNLRIPLKKTRMMGRSPGDPESAGVVL